MAVKLFNSFIPDFHAICLTGVMNVISVMLVTQSAVAPPSTASRRIVVSFKRKYVNRVLVNVMFKLTQEKSVGR